MKAISLIMILCAFAFNAKADDTTVAAATTIDILRPVTVPFEEKNLSQLKLPTDFQLNVYATGLKSPRMMAEAADGALYVTTNDGDIVRLYDTDADGVADTQAVLLNIPTAHGIAISNGQIYIATTKALMSATIQTDGSLSPMQTIVADLPDGGQHGRRTLVFGPDGYIYLSVGSTCNACIETNRENATILRMKPDGSERAIFASGLRNTIGYAFHPVTGELWGMDQGTDMLGSAQPGEELNKLVQSANYGWPFYVDKGIENPQVDWPKSSLVTKEEFFQTVSDPLLTYSAHASPIGFVFYGGDDFTDAYKNGAFVAFHGSWNAKPAMGYEVAFVRFDDQGQPMAFEPFLTGFLLPDGVSAVGRPAGLLVYSDGSLLISDDATGVIYRVIHMAPQTDTPQMAIPTVPQQAPAVAR